MSDFKITKNGVLTAYYGNDEMLIIPDGVRVIGKGIVGFTKGRDVRKVIIPEGVTEIRSNAFRSSQITEVVLPSSLRTIGSHAFAYCDNLKSLTIPEGVEIIPGCMCWGSGLEEATLPQSIKEIGTGAFGICHNLKRIIGKNPETIKLGECAFTQCWSMVDQRGMLILQNRLFTYYSPRTGNHVKIPETVTEIETSAFFACRQIHLEMSLRCPNWQQHDGDGHTTLATSLLDRSGSSITFRDEEGRIAARIVLAHEDETQPKVDQAVLSLRSSNHCFDFAHYDACFSVLAKSQNKLKIALARLEYPYHLSNEMEVVYLDYLKRRALAAGKLLIEDNRLELFSMLTEKGMFGNSAVSKLREHAAAALKPAFTAVLLDYKYRAGK